MASNSGKKARKQMYEDVGYRQETTRISVQKFPKLAALTYAQEDLIDAMHNKPIVFALGSAGSGKS